MTELWTTYEGELLDGEYRLQRCLSDSSTSGVYLTYHGDRTATAIIEAAGTERAERLQSRWKLIASLAHPNLLRLLATGLSTLGGTPVVYAVIEQADEDLASVLPERALTVEETREVLESALAALSYLHGQGLVHGSLKAPGIAAVGDTVKLTVDTVSEAAATAGEGPTPADDVFALGAAVYEMLTQRQWAKGAVPDKIELRGVDKAFYDPLLNTLTPDRQRRWSVAQIQAWLRGERPTGEPPKKAIDRERASRSATPPVETGVPGRPATNPRWAILMGILALLVIGYAILRAGRKTDQAPSSAAASGTQTTQSRLESSVPAKQEVPMPPRAGEAVGLRPSPLSTPTATESATPPPAAGDARQADGWMVVVATYKGENHAEKRVQTIRERWPSFHPEVYPPQGSNPRYVVIIGSNLTQKEAAALRGKALAAGFPRDTFIKQFKTAD